MRRCNNGEIWELGSEKRGINLAKDTISTIMDRRSIRRYRPDPIPEEDIQTILEAGRQAPSGGNRQPWHFVVSKDPEIRRRVADACNGQMWMAETLFVVRKTRFL